jgi:iron complex outermembrane receptor protein
MSNSKSLLTPAVILLIGASGAQGIQAQESSNRLEEVVVTAERRTENLQKTAASITVRSGEELQQQGRYSLADIIKDIPGMSGGAPVGASGNTNFTDNTASGLVFRGIPSNSGVGGANVSTAASAAIYVDGVLEGVGSSYDIDRVEVLRGPQGTLYGRSATSGVLAIHTRNPSLDRFGVNATIEAGTHSLRHYSAGVDLPITNNVLGLRLSGNAYDRDGLYNGDGGAIRNRDGRAKLLFKPNDNFSLLIGFAAQNNSTYTGGSTVAQSSDPHTVNRVPTSPPSIAEARTKYRQVWLETNWDLGFGTLTYQPAWRSYWQESPTIAAMGPVTVSQLTTMPSDKFVTHEIRLASKPDSKLIWQVGGLYYDNKISNSTSSLRFLPSNALGFSSATSKSTKAAGIFAQATYPFTDAWRVTTGVRYDHTKVVTVEDYTANINPGIGLPPNAPNFRLPEQLATLSLPVDEGTRQFNNVTYKLRAEHDLSASNLLYASVSTGFSPGDVSAATCANSTPCVLVVQAETLTSYEIGSKNRFLDDRLQFNGDVFFNDYGAYQAQNIDISGGTNPGNPSFATLAVPVESYGLELESLFLLTIDDRLSLNLAAIKSHYVHKSAFFANAIANDSIIGSPITATLSYDRAIHLPGGSSLTARASARFLSAHEGSISAQNASLGGAQYAHIDSQWIGDLNLNWVSPGGHYNAGIWVRNVGDNRYIQGVTLAVPTAQQSPTTTGFYFTPTQADPRTIGASFGINF